MTEPLLWRFFQFFLLAVLAAPVWAEKHMKGDDLSNIIVQGENRLKVRARAPSLDWTVNPYKEVPDLLANNVLLSDLRPPSIGKPPVVLPEKSLSRKTASPWLANIVEAPLLTLDLKSPAPAKNAKGKDEARRWVFLVKDSQGNVFYEIKKTSVLPPAISWDGFGKGGPLQVGRDYTYSFSAVDKAGNAQRFAGKPFRLEAFRYRRMGKSVTLLSSDALFLDSGSTQRSDKGNSLLKEVLDAIRTAYGTSVTIGTYEKDAAFALTRAQILRNDLATELDWPQDKITAQAHTLKKGGDSYVEIITE